MQTVWITGASSGIGKACALRYASLGARLILTSSNAEKLQAVADSCIAAGAAEAIVLPYDFSSAEGTEPLVGNAWKQAGRIDILFLNAGISQRATVEETSPEMNRRIMEVNYFSPAAMARAILPLMCEAGGGSIAVTTSIAGRFGFPLRCAYSSSKHALYGYFETLQAEYYNKGIRVTLVCPGRVRTDISRNALGPDGQKHGVMDPGQDGGISPEKAAVIIEKAIRKGKREVAVGGKELIMLVIKRFFPGLCARLSRKINPT